LDITMKFSLLPVPFTVAGWLTLLLLVSSATLWGAGDPSRDPTLDRILEDWRTRQNEIKVLRYEVVGTRTWVQGSIDDHESPDTSTPNPEQDITGRSNVSALLWPQANRFRLEHKVQGYSSFHRTLFDQRFISGGNEESVWTRTLEDNWPGYADTGRARNHADLFTVTGHPDVMPPVGGSPFGDRILFYGFGLVHAGGALTRATRLIPEVDASVFSFRGWQEHQGRRVAVVRERITDFWVNLEKQSAIERVVGTLPRDQHPQLIAEINWRETAVGWLPSDWEVRMFVMGRLTSILNAVVVEIDTNPPTDPALFSFAPEPGMVVDEQKWLPDGAGGVSVQKTLYRVGAWGRIIKLDENFYPLWRTKIWQWLLLGMIGLGPVLYFWLWRRGRSSPVPAR
jgi:hypothetical protein